MTIGATAVMAIGGNVAVQALLARPADSQSAYYVVQSTHKYDAYAYAPVLPAAACVCGFASSIQICA